MTAQGFRPGFRAIVAGLATVAAITLGWFNLYQHRKFHPLYDGVTWQDTEHGVVAQDVIVEGPGARAGIQVGDMLLSINKAEVKSTPQVARILDKFHDWQDAEYALSREGQPFTAKKVILEPEPANSLLPFLQIVGLLYLGVGLFVVLRRPNAPRSGHFYVFCLASFALYFYHYTGKFNPFDWSIYWLNVIAWLLQPPLFLHFALVFPKPKPFLGRHRLALPLLYLPGALLLVTHVAVAIDVVRVHLPLSAVRWGLDRLELLYMGVMYLAAAAVLHHTYRKADTVVLRQQMKWVTRGTTVAIVPFVCIYVLRYALGQIPSSTLNVFVLALALIPITFGYAIFRWRLMDVDILFRRGIVYTLATAVLVAFYFTLAALGGWLLQAILPETGAWGWITAVVATAFLFQPLRNSIQERLDRFFYRESYDYRRTLVEFGRDISAEVDLDRLIDRTLDRLARTLGVECVAVFLTRDEGEAAGDDPLVRMERSLGVSYHGALDLSFLDPNAAVRGPLFFENVHQAVTETPSARRTIEELELHYYVPCQAQGRVVAYLGLGKTREGDFLSTEDVALIETLSGYLGTAIENARLYRRLERKVQQYERLKEYSENIVESVNVGILALDLEDRIESWNTQVELMYGITRDRAIGCRIDEVFPPDLVAELIRLRSTENPTGIHNLYKYKVRTSAGAERVFNVAVAPLVAKDFEMVGRLVIFDDITERVDLERQVTHADKLSSIGLLAAGVAHEVNTPLAVISSYAQMLSKQLPESDPRGKLLERITRSTFRASEIVNNLLNFSRTGSAEFADLDVNQVIGDTLALLEHQFKTGRITVDRKLRSDNGDGPERLVIHGNSGKLQQVFLNLFLNAREAMPEGGTLSICSEARESRVYVKVADTGQGIDPRYVDRIYDPFFTTKPPKGKVRTDAQQRGDGKGRDPEAFRGGTGLGLSVTYGIVQEHAGKIAVESAPSLGTTFTLEFPLAPSRTSEHRTEAVLASRRQAS
jgi:two-component system, NtrC family, sensor kinase